jgi:hypothetical protein
MMKIIDARWTPRVNILKIRCVCGHEFEHRAARRWVRCICGHQEDLLFGELRSQTIG